MFKRRSAIATLFWIATACLVGYSLQAYRPGPSPVKELLPRVGAKINADSARAALGADIRGQETWVFVVSSTCPACLKLDAELDVLRDGAACANAKLLPLITEGDAPPDAMRIILERHRILNPRIGSRNDAHRLGVYAVPTLLRIDSRSRVRSIANPGFGGNWMKVPKC
jgi:hypothetical protein